MSEQAYVVKMNEQYFCGHKCAGRASWRPKFVVKWTMDITKATVFTDPYALNCRTNLTLMGYGLFSDAIPVESK